MISRGQRGRTHPGSNWDEQGAWKLHRTEDEDHLLPDRPLRSVHGFRAIIMYVVITLNIINYNIHHILINNKSLNDVLFYDVFIKIGLFLLQLERRSTPPPWSVSLKAPCPSKDLSK